MRRLNVFSAAAVFCVAGSGALAQLNDINSVRLFEREFNDNPGTTLLTVSNFPTIISFTESGYNGDGFANRHVARFSADGGATSRLIQNSDSFYIRTEVTMNSTASAPRKEAGILLDTLGGQGQFIVNSDAHEIVAFGGPLPFFAFPATYDLGETIVLEMVYNANGNSLADPATIEYRANGVSSGAIAFSNLEFGIIDGSTAGLYTQFPTAGVGQTNSTVFGNIVVIPAPGALALGLLGIAAAGRRRR
ncbi:MAG: hypothetical protein H7Y88_01630 [Phycisphaerales bacterium]|nr:hypothetical protein [Phycisphaerales bacterium]